MVDCRRARPQPQRHPIVADGIWTGRIRPLLHPTESGGETKARSPCMPSQIGRAAKEPRLMEDAEGHKVDLDFLNRPEVLRSVYKAGETIFESGSPASEMFIVRSGRVGVSINGKIVEEVGAGGLFGEMALI